MVILQIHNKMYSLGVVKFYHEMTGKKILSILFFRAASGDAGTFLILSL